MKRLIICLLFMVAILFPQTAKSETTVSFSAVAEYGFIGIIFHEIQLGKNGTTFDYVKSGGQNLLFPAQRYSMEMDINKRNTFILLYQPLLIETKATLREDFTFYDLTYPAGSAIECVYSFPFYRASYLREFLHNNDKYDLAFGATIQIRNAAISFESTDGTRYRETRGAGIVPALKIRTRYNINDYFYTEVEADGIYAPVSYLNGSDNEIVGAILDASVRLAANITDPLTLFVNTRYIGGGSTGTSLNPTWPSDGYAKNWIHFLNLSLGTVYAF